MTTAADSAFPAQNVICLMGPTGAGKTAASLALAEALEVSVINADSRQLYKDFPLITAQPSPEERAACPHLLYGWLETQASLGAGAYARLAAQAVAKVCAAKRLPLLVGGTGLYFKALLEGIASIPPVPASVNEAWQSRCEQEGSPALHALLQQADPPYAAKIHPNDRQRITRALAVHEATGKSFSWWHERPVPRPEYAACKIGITMPMPLLEKRLAQRIEAMLEQGALDEARAALERCPDPAAPGWSGIGCRETMQYLSGTISLDECRALWLKNTRAYAKRQNTWFRADPAIRWFAPHETEAVTRHVLAFLDGAVSK